jgi:hypothetical protein
MNSSTSSSDVSVAGHRWPGFALWLVATLAGVTLGLLALMMAVDPYDTGRASLFETRGVRPQGPRTAHASRGRDPAFNAAIFGNSHMQLLEPAALSQATGSRVVSLTVPATGPKEQLTLISWFLRHHHPASRAPADALIIGADTLWCTADPALPNEKPFPFWLYEESPLRYAAGLLRFDLIEELPRRIRYIAGGKRERAVQDGWWDYEPEYIGLGFDKLPEKRAALETPQPATTINETGPFPALPELRAVLDRLGPDVPVVMVRPPLYYRSLPAADTSAGRSEAACLKAMQEFAAARPRTALVDWRTDRPQTRDASLWFDHSHYRKPVATAMQADIALALSLLR